uniref:Gypsy retrotransposon integrase-like protein 1 n=1 Tax=Gasterosteus aculeatus aculeatus TaxID=481459 RepID=A0AAQ4QC33_GASAC
MAGVEEFIAIPSEQFLDQCTRDQLLKIADHYKISVGDRRLKENVRFTIRAHLYDIGVLTPVQKSHSPTNLALDECSQDMSHSVALNFEQQKEMLILRMKLEKEKELELERMRQQAEGDKALALEKMRQQTEMAKLDLESERLRLVKEGKFNDFSRNEEFARSSGNSSDILNSLRLVPKFSEKDVDVFFTLFERIADTRGWVDSDRIVLLQCVLTGRAQEVFSSLSLEDSGDYAKVKTAVLKTYELVPEAYCQRFRSWKKGDKSYLEFSRDLGIHFSRWCSASEVKDFDDLCNLMVLEQFKNSVPERIAMYISERKVRTAGEAAALADDYFLTHKGSGVDVRTHALSAGNVAPAGGMFFSRASGGGLPREQRVDHGVRDSECHFCHRYGHWKRDCVAFKLRNRQDVTCVKPVALAAPISNVLSDQSRVESPVVMSKPDLSSYLPFISKGHASLVGNNKRVPVTILRDTGALDSFVLESALPFSEETDTGSFVPVLGMGMSIFHVPVHKLVLHSELFEGEVKMGVRPALPIDGVTVILGNDVAGARVWGSSAVHPVVVPVPLGSNGPDENEKQFPEVFTACAVTRAMKRPTDYAEPIEVEDVESEALELFVMTLSNTPLSVSHSELARELRADGTLKELFQSVLRVDEVKDRAHGYFVQNEVLVRKWVPHCESFVGDPVYQIVVPSKFRDLVLRVAHDESGHMGVGKTYDRVLRHFFWPRMKKSVANYIKTCHTCQLTGKPNQKVKVAPQYPIPVVDQPFEHLIIDCVGPLPRSRSGAMYLLTVMCSSTRYPAAYPLRTLTAKSVVRALGQFISIFGIPRTIQRDQGSNFSSHLFAQVLKLFHVQHNQSSAYHAQSQGALERVHQTVKSMLKAYHTRVSQELSARADDPQSVCW